MKWNVPIFGWARGAPIWPSLFFLLLLREKKLLLIYYKKIATIIMAPRRGLTRLVGWLVGKTLGTTATHRVQPDMLDHSPGLGRS